MLLTWRFTLDHVYTSLNLKNAMLSASSTEKSRKKKKDWATHTQDPLKQIVSHSAAIFEKEAAVAFRRSRCPKNTHFFNSTVTMPFGWISTDFPQNFNFGSIDPKKCHVSVEASKALTGGWWDTWGKVESDNIFFINSSCSFSSSLE